VKRLKTVFSDQACHSGAESGLSVPAANLAVSDPPGIPEILLCSRLHDGVSVSFVAECLLHLPYRYSSGSQEISSLSSGGNLIQSRKMMKSDEVFSPWLAALERRDTRLT